MNKINGNIKMKEKSKGREQKMTRIIRTESLVGVHTHTHTHTSDLEKIINRYK